MWKIILKCGFHSGRILINFPLMFPPSQKIIKTQRILILRELHSLHAGYFNHLIIRATVNYGI